MHNLNALNTIINLLYVLKLWRPQNSVRACWAASYVRFNPQIFGDILRLHFQASDYGDGVCGFEHPAAANSPNIFHRLA